MLRYAEEQITTMICPSGNAFALKTAFETLMNTLPSLDLVKPPPPAKKAKHCVEGEAWREGTISIDRRPSAGFRMVSRLVPFRFDEDLCFHSSKLAGNTFPMKRVWCSLQTGIPE